MVLFLCTLRDYTVNDYQAPKIRSVDQPAIFIHSEPDVEETDKFFIINLMSCTKIEFHVRKKGRFNHSELKSKQATSI